MVPQIQAQCLGCQFPHVTTAFLGVDPVTHRMSGPASSPWDPRHAAQAAQRGSSCSPESQWHLKALRPWKAGSFCLLYLQPQLLLPRRARLPPAGRGQRSTWSPLRLRFRRSGALDQAQVLEDLFCAGPRGSVVLKVLSPVLPTSQG